MNPKKYVLQSPDGSETLTTTDFANCRDLIRSANWSLISDTDLPLPPAALPIATLPRPVNAQELFAVRSPDGSIVEEHSFQNASDLARNQGWKIVGRSSQSTDIIKVSVADTTGGQPATISKLQVSAAPAAIEAAAPAAAPAPVGAPAVVAEDEKPAKRKRRTKAEIAADEAAAAAAAETVASGASLHDVVLADAETELDQQIAAAAAASAASDVIELPQAVAAQLDITATLGPSFFDDFADLSTETLIAGAKGMEIEVDGAWSREKLIQEIELTVDTRLITSGDFEGIETPDASDDEEETAAKLEAITQRRTRGYLLEAERQGFEMPSETPSFAKFIESFAATE